MAERHQSFIIQSDQIGSFRGFLYLQYGCGEYTLVQYLYHVLVVDDDISAFPYSVEKAYTSYMSIPGARITSHLQELEYAVNQILRTHLRVVMKRRQAMVMLIRGYQAGRTSPSKRICHLYATLKRSRIRPLEDINIAVDRCRPLLTQMLLVVNPGFTLVNYPCYLIKGQKGQNTQINPTWSLFYSSPLRPQNTCLASPVVCLPGESLFFLLLLFYFYILQENLRLTALFSPRTRHNASFGSPS